MIIVECIASYGLKRKTDIKEYQATSAFAFIGSTKEEVVIPDKFDDPQYHRLLQS